MGALCYNKSIFSDNDFGVTIMELTQRKKAIFQAIHDAVGLTPKVFSFGDEVEKNHIDIYIGTDRPDIGLSTYSTIGLSEYPIGLVDSSTGRQIRVEFIGMCDSTFADFPNVLASCAFNIINDQYSCSPGMVYLNVINQYYNNSEMRHIYFTDPSYWDDLYGFDLDGNYVTWLFAIPISDKELDYLEKHGDDEFEKLFEENNTEVFNLYRYLTISDCSGSPFLCQKWGFKPQKHSLFPNYITSK